MVTVELIPEGIRPLNISYVVIAARYKGGWLFVKHRRRGGWEMPAGHPGPGENTVEAAVRELMEETGAARFLAEQTMTMLGSYGPWYVIGGLYIVTAAANMVIPAAALVVLMSPIVITASNHLGFEPQTAMMAIAMAASASFSRKSAFRSAPP